MSERVEAIKAMYDKMYDLQKEIWKSIDGTYTLEEMAEIRTYFKKKEQEFNNDEN